MTECDVVIIGGGPAGLAAALTLGRARRRVLVFDAGAPRNARADRIHNFLSRDGTPPSELRQIARDQIAQYVTVGFREERVTSIGGARDQFEVQTASGTVKTRRVILCTGMIDEMLPIPGFEEAWGHSIYQCPYCHGWEVKDRRWGYLALGPEGLQHGFGAMLQSWTDDVVVFTTPKTELPDELIDRMKARKIRYEPRPVESLVVNSNGALQSVVLADGAQVSCEVLYAHPPQQQVKLVQSLELDLDEFGYVKADPMTRQTSVPGIYAAGDLTTRAQGAIFAAATGSQAAAMTNHDLAMS